MVQSLMGALDDKDWTVRRAACEELAGLESLAEPAVPKLFELLSSPDDQEAARDALRDINSVGVEAVPLLAAALDDPERRFFAVYLLGRAGKAAQPAVPKLRELRDAEENERFRRLLASTIDRIENGGRR